jgi:hypothetical protein
MLKVFEVELSMPAGAPLVFADFTQVHAPEEIGLMPPPAGLSGQLCTDAANAGAAAVAARTGIDQAAPLMTVRRFTPACVGDARRISGALELFPSMMFSPELKNRPTGGPSLEDTARF